MAVANIHDLAGREHGSKVIGEVTLDQVYGGARGVKSLVWEVGGNSVHASRKRCGC